MSFAEFNQAKEELSGIVAFETEPERSVTPPDEHGHLLFPSLPTDEKTGSFLVFNLEDQTWGTLVRSHETPYNDCLPPGDTLLLEGFQQHSTPEDILEFLQDSTEDAFVNAFEVVLGNLDGSELEYFVGSVQSRHRTLPLGHYRLSDSAPLESVDDPPTEGLTSLLARHVNPDEVTDHLTDELLQSRLGNDGMRELAYVMVFRWNPDGLAYRAGSDLEELESSGLTSIQADGG